MSDTVTLALEGVVPLAAFADAFDGWRRLIDALSKEHAKGILIEWTIDHLDVSSALATVRGESSAPYAVEEVAAAYLNVGRAEAQHELLPYAAPVKKALESITRVRNGKVHAI